MYQFKTNPFKHQRHFFDYHKDDKVNALFWEQGCGKTKPVIDKTCYLYEQEKIDALIVIAPNGVHRNWVTDEIPAHMPDRVAKVTETFIWDSNRSDLKGFQKELKWFEKHEGFSVLVMSYNAIMTKRGKDFLWKFLRHKTTHMVLDESHYIKTPGAKRTIRLLAAGKYAAYKSILTGTPIAKGPFDVYAPVKFLDDFFWHDRRLGSLQAFKTYFGIWLRAEDLKRDTGLDPGYDQLLGYKNIDKLEVHLKEISHRLTKDDAGLDLPPKLYSKRYVKLTAAQDRLYKELVSEFTAELDSGETVDAGLAIVRLLRLQQITCGYVGTEPGEPLILLGDKNPRMEALKEICENTPHKAIIWARFTEDINQIMDLLGDEAVRYDGQVSNDEKAAAKESFQNGEAKFFVGNPQAGATGLTLHAARTVVYYSNSFNLVDRLQSEDRAHRIGQEHPVNYIDLVVQGSVDEHIVKSLRSKHDIADEITGDKVKEWL